MASNLASIYGTEKDKVNCSFYFKIGACRHGEKCSRKHVRPAFSQTIVLPNIYINPGLDPSNDLTAQQVQDHFDAFYEDFYVEFSNKFGEIEELHVCDNIGDHLVGNVYVRFRNEDDAQKAVDNLNNRFYAERPIWAELSPVTDFRESCCRQYEIAECAREGFCNFMHLKKATALLKRDLVEGQKLSVKQKKLENADKPRESRDKDRDSRRRSRSRSRSRGRRSSRDRR